MRNVRDVLAQLERAEQDDRDTRSRSDAAKERKASEQMLAELARQLVSLSDKRLNSLDLPEPVLDGVHAARTIRSHIARNRALRRLRTYLRQADIESVREQLEDVHHNRPPHAAAQPSDAEHSESRDATVSARAQSWTAHLLEHGDSGLSEFITQFPQAPRQQLRQCMRNATKPSNQHQARALLLQFVADILAERSAREDQTGA